MTSPANSDTVAAREARAKRRAAVRDSVRTKARYDSLVLRWQEKLLGPEASELLLRQAAQYLTPEDFDSVIMERTSGGLCGYPLCANPTRKLKQRYHISIRQRKVFDMEEHASYCSNRCMVGSRFYKQQLSEDPVYMRSREESLDIEVLPLSIGDSQNSVSHTASSSATSAEAIHASDKSLINWYRDSLMAKMNIPRRVADANPLLIVEHSSVTAVDHDLSAAVGKLQFADIEGFEPEADVSRIKKAVSFASKLGKGRDSKRAESGCKTTDNTDYSCVGADSASKGNSLLQRAVDLESSPRGPPTLLDAATPYNADTKGKDSDESVTNESSDYDEDGDDDDDDEDSDSPTNGPTDSGYFAKLFDVESSHSGSRPALSMFGRMWILADRIVTEKTLKYLHDLKKSGAGLNMIEYYIAPGDQAMAIRHDLLVGAVTRELDTVRNKLQLQAPLRRELQLLVSTLELGSNMAVFSKPETRILCITFALALVRAVDPPHPLNDPKSALPDLDQVLCELGTDRASLSMVSRRFHEPY